MRNRFELPIERELAKSGKVYERFLLGRPRVEAEDYINGAQNLIAQHRATGRKIDFAEAVEVVRRSQPFEPDRNIPQDPSKPVKQFPRSILERVAAKVGLAGPERKRVRFLTAVDTLLDGAGADAVIEVAGKPGEPSQFVRLDVTRYPEEDAVAKAKEESTKRLFANVPPLIVIRDVPEIEDPRDITDPASAYNKFVDSAAAEIHSALGSRLPASK